jgi:PPOX class probable F420-dependent enzyme
MAWIGVEDDEVVIGTLPDQAKLRNIRRDHRVALSMLTGARNAYGLDEYVVLHGRARVTEGGAAELLGRLARVYLGPDARFPPMPDPPQGWVIRITVDRVVGLGATT